MKFNNIQELWDYCSYCPICTRKCREVVVSVGPDDHFILVDFEKEGTNLQLQCTFKNKSHIYSAEYNIDCLNNSFSVKIPKVQSVPEGETAEPERATRAYFFFFLEGLCRECNCTSAHGKDLELRVIDNKIFDIELERENFYLLEGKDKFHVSPIHDRNVMQVNRCYPDDDGISFNESKKIIELPLVKLDLADQERVVSKLKT